MFTVKKIIFFLIIGAIVVLPVNYLSASPKQKKLNIYLEYFYNRYSKNFDAKGLKYIAPSYGIVNYKKAQTFREWVALGSYYKYRAHHGNKKAKKELKKALTKGIKEFESRPAYTQSFNDAEAIFLTIRILDYIPDLINKQQKRSFLFLVKNNIKKGIKANDTENRAIIAGSHWQYINNYLYRKKRISLDDKNYLSSLIKNKIDNAIEESINDKYWYFENGRKDFSVHYHVVSAFMLLWYGNMTKQDYYTNIARMMYINTKKMSFYNGMVEAKIGRRPPGLGAQFYLMMALIGQYFNDDDYRVYLSYSRGSRFFSNPNRPNQLEYHSTIENTLPNFHDDYAFSDVGEIGLVMSKYNNMNLEEKYSFTNQVSQAQDQYFHIINSENSIIINGMEIILGSFGNWSNIR